jgi:glycosyltransferase involved in cell wall biosynthesis
MPTCAFLSFRLGLTDGVSIVAEHWMQAFRSFGFDIVSVAGDGPVDRCIPGLAIGARHAPTADAVSAALADVELVVVENLLTIPMNLPASRVVAAVLRGRPAVLHHHDPPWQRERYRHVSELPLDDPAWRHVVINRTTATEMKARGIDADVVYNGFETRPRIGERDSTRARLDVAPEERLLVHPVRAIDRKGVPEAVALAEQLGATYWLTGPAEEDYAPTLAATLARARCRVVHRSVDGVDDLYAAADVVAFPSTWEGFGNPPIEASIRLRPVAVRRYPIAEEFGALGFRWFDTSDPEPLGAFLRQPDSRLLRHNRAIARQHFSLEIMSARLRALLEDAGWLP